MAKFTENYEQSIFRENVTIGNVRYTVEFPRVVDSTPKATVLRKDTVIDSNGKSTIVPVICGMGESGKVLAKTKVYGKYNPRH